MTKKNLQIVEPTISIVTVVYNCEKFIEEAIRSVIDQDYKNIEYIIIDGGSTDNTLNIIKKFEKKISYWISEPDQGQSDAFIKGFKKCNGEWLTWLNADDILLPGTIKELVQNIKKYPRVDCFAGNIIWINENKKLIKTRKGEAWLNVLPKFGILNVYGPSTFFKYALYNNVEGLNKDLHYKMDTDLWWQFYNARAKFKRLNGYSWALRLHPDAKMSGHNFSESETSDLNHPSWKQKKSEDDYIIEKNKINSKRLSKYFGKILLTFLRLTSFNYLISYWYSKKYFGKDLGEFILKIR